MYDVAIIGGGVLGNMIARDLSRFKLDVIVLEKEYDVGEGTTKANSGIIHAGFHPRGGSLKGLSCVEGNAAYPQLCADLDIPFKQIGSLFIAFHAEGVEHLHKVMERGMKNGVPAMQMLERDEVLAMEPNLSPHVIKALYAPSTGIISPFDLVVALAESAAINGVEYAFNSQVVSLENAGDSYLLHTHNRDIKASYIINTAGGFAGNIEAFVRPADLVIKPRRGQYYILNNKSGAVVNHVIHQAAETDEGGILLTPTVEGNLLIGPTSENVPDFSHVETTKAGLDRIEKVARKILPDFDISQVITNFAGLRANITNVVKEEKDFVIRLSAPRFISALGIKNPGMTSSPALSRIAIELLQSEGLVLEAKKDFIAKRQGICKFLLQTPEQQQRMLQENPAEAKIVCRCEGITEGDIIRAIRRPLGATSLDGLKKRLRLGMGICQGGFCTMRAIEILSWELAIPAHKVPKNTSGSYLVAGGVK